MKLRWISKRTALLGAVLAFLRVPPARADSWVGDSLELMAADADLVVRGRLETIIHVDGIADQRATLRVEETLKGNAAQNLECFIPYGEEHYAAEWQKEKTELLLCLVKSTRYRLKRSKELLGAEWSVRRGASQGGETGIIPLDGNPGRRAPTLDFRCLMKAEEILQRAGEAVRADAGTKVARESDGAVPSLMMNVPVGSPLDEQLHSMSSNGLGVPLNEMTEAKATEWIKGNDSERENGVAVLAHFKSEDNIAALKALLVDPEVQASNEDANLIRKYPVRAAALAALKAWGVQANAVVSETVPNKDR